jgi:protein TonB
MRLASFLSPPDADHADRRRRVLSFVLTVAAHLLLLLMLLRLAPPFAKMADRGSQLLSFNTAPDEQEETTQSKSTAKTKTTHASAPPTPTVPPPKIVLQDKAAPWVLTPGLEKFDVRQVPPTQKPSQSPSDASASDEANGNSDSDRPVAYGSGGQPLYAAQWYREPTNAELGYYLKDARPGPGFGEIACQTIARYHVDHCEEMGETPGSGFARAVREAAWQFLVLPPRIGGRIQVGTWVVIRITYSEDKAR